MCVVVPAIAAIAEAASAAAATVGTAASAAGSFVAANAGAISAVTAIGSAGVAAYGASQQADAQQKAAGYQAQVDANNATIAGYQRSAALQQGESQAQQSMLRQASVLGQQRAALAANGVDVSQGSALDALSSTRFLGQQDVNVIQSNAAREAWGYGVQGGNDAAASALSRWRADNTSPFGAGAMAAGSSLLSSASQYVMK